MVQRKKALIATSLPILAKPLKRSLLDQILGVFIRKKTTPQNTPTTNTPIQKEPEKKVHLIKIIPKSHNKKTQTRLKTSKSNKKTKIKKKQIRIKARKEKVSSEKLKPQNKITVVPKEMHYAPATSSSTSKNLPIISPLPSNNVPSSFSEIEDEALRVKVDANQIAKEKINSIEEKKKIIELGIKINSNKKMTNFDRVLNAVRLRGKVTAHTLQKELNIPEKEFADCYKILEKNGEIEIEYPLVGRMKLVAVKKEVEDNL